MDTTTLNILIGGIIGVCGTLLGTIVNGYFSRKNLTTQLKFNQIETERKLYLENLEILHFSIGKCLSSSAGFVARIQTIPINNDGLRLYSEAADEVLRQYTEAYTKLQIYAPEFNEQWEGLMEVVKANFQLSQQLMTNKSRFIADLAQNHDVLVNRIQSIHKNIESKIRLYVSSDNLPQKK